MKKIKILLKTIFVFISLYSIINTFFFKKEDVNKDGKVNAVDYIIIKNYIMKERNDK